jgi:hypothetical protein
MVSTQRRVYTARSREYNSKATPHLHPDAAFGIASAHASGSRRGQPVKLSLSNAPKLDSPMRSEQVGPRVDDGKQMPNIVFHDDNPRDVDGLESRLGAPCSSRPATQQCYSFHVHSAVQHESD